MDRNSERTAKRIKGFYLSSARSVRNSGQSGARLLQVLGVLGRYKPYEIGQFVQGYDASRWLMRNQTKRLVRIVHHQNRVEPQGFGRVQPLQGVGEIHGLGGLKSGALKRAGKRCALA